MQIIQIEILNPKVKSILQNLEGLNLISIQENNSAKFQKLASKIRQKNIPSLTLDDIQKEVEQVRQKRYERKKK